MSAPYHVTAFLGTASDDELQRWAADPDCAERNDCYNELAERLAKRESDTATITAKKAQLEANPFDPRTEVSADAKYIAKKIVTHLWILFVLLPVIVGVLLALAGVIK